MPYSFVARGGAGRRGALAIPKPCLATTQDSLSAHALRRRGRRTFLDCGKLGFLSYLSSLFNSQGLPAALDVLAGRRSAVGGRA